MAIPAGHKIHFIGIGGVSMSALALALAARGYRVSGSDRDAGERLPELRAAGIPVVVGQRAQNVGHADLYVFTTAVRDDNPELIGARATGKPVLHRSEVLASLLEGHRSIAVTGTHGKSTTTAMIGACFLRLGLDPTVFVGGEVPDIGGCHHLGRSDTFIFEACESDGSFLRYKHCSQVLTNVEPDHLDEHGTFEHLQEAYAKFLASADPQGFLAYRADDPVAARLAAASPAEKISFALEGPARVQARNIAPAIGGVRYRPVVDGTALPTVQLQLPGRHNVANALGATAAALGRGLDLEAVCAALEQFRGVGRRFELLGQYHGALVFEDYAHHPTEVRAALQAARDSYDLNLIVVFQPHLYSRTQFFMDEFAAAFDAADMVVVADIYAAREQPLPGVTSARLSDLIADRHREGAVHYIGGCDAIVEFVAQLAAPGQLIMAMGAGDICQVGRRLAAMGAQDSVAHVSPQARPSIA